MPFQFFRPSKAATAVVDRLLVTDVEGAFKASLEARREANLALDLLEDAHGLVAAQPEARFLAERIRNFIARATDDCRYGATLSPSTSERFNHANG